MAEGHRGRIAAVLPADAKLDVVLDAARPLDRELHQGTDALLVERLERVALEHAVLQVARQELALGVVAREAERCLREVVRAERAEVGKLGDLVGPDARARQLDHRADRVAGEPFLLGDGDGERAQTAELLGEADEWVHDLDDGLVADPAFDRDRGPRDGTHLHLVDLRILQAQPAAARAQHRVRLVQRPDPLAHSVGGGLLERRQELVQWRVEQADRDREPGHRLEDPLEVGLLHRQQLVERRATILLGDGEDHLLHHRQPLLLHEHVLGAAEADALGAELARLGGVLRRVGVGAHAQPAHVVGPGEDRLEVLVDAGRNQLDMADDDDATAAVDRDHVALAQGVRADRDRAGLEIERQAGAARDTRLAHAARDDGGVRGHATVRRQHAAGLDQAVDVVRRGLPAHEDHVLARLALLLGAVGGEDDLAARGAGRSVEALGGDLVGRGRVERRMQELVELARVDPGDGLLLLDQALADHVDRALQRCGRRTLGGARLQEVELAVLDGELDVLHVVVVLLEPVHRIEQLLIGRRQLIFHPLERLRRADTRDDVLALGVCQELAVEATLAGRWVAGKADARAGALALVAEDHLHDVDRAADRVRDLVYAAVHLRARRVPGVEYRIDRPAQLLACVGGERAADLLRVDRLEGSDELL